MSRKVIVDTGALIAFLLPKDKFHTWAVTQFSNITAPVITNEAVITEACFLARRIHQGQATILNLIQQGHIVIPFSLNQEIEAVNELMQRYASVPMSLADACLVRMSEMYEDSQIITLDSDFQIYRKHRNQTIPIIMPLNN
ncbi:MULTISPECIES: type II toxin-antitoxin system VapC family toxin [unclassified Roseofilum]|uniref:type II toxin-antitoxin system VapC family toxin n=1 Tax=unclassified Roseofilum TaxID=2620099 RepID=UPI000E9AC541|nr:MULTISPECIES: PIN domain-containing protein [unclassified Roseofilum]HBQ97724.1 pilus assembly protein [Cyanobacteria bacterium UBA11691]MBP0011312.1 PIN domain-containing protein [Roseofilum sp. Belize Diploria]MBP0025434.1 PIN domain-containing protein [Roseofilum sp. SID2]MBP0035843.1 PIN domain-containing protein [Roseofilum sp. Belize BBD 4]MBP0037532.1 PIN domain-containing protein [Roseofilum sp. SID1]